MPSHDIRHAAEWMLASIPMSGSSNSARPRSEAPPPGRARGRIRNTLRTGISSRRQPRRPWCGLSDSGASATGTISGLKSRPCLLSTDFQSGRGLFMNRCQSGCEADAPRAEGVGPSKEARFQRQKGNHEMQRTAARLAQARDGETCEKLRISQIDAEPGTPQGWIWMYLYWMSRHPTLLSLLF